MTAAAAGRTDESARPVRGRAGRTRRRWTNEKQREAFLAEWAERDEDGKARLIAHWHVTVRRLMRRRFASGSSRRLALEKLRLAGAITDADVLCSAGGRFLPPLAATSLFDRWKEFEEGRAKRWGDCGGEARVRLGVRSSMCATPTADIASSLT